MEWIVRAIAQIRIWILQLNNFTGIRLSDEMLHFIIIGIVGMVLFSVAYPVIRFLSRRGRETAISWGFTLAVLAVLAFGAALGREITAIGDMDLMDIACGIGGYLAMFFVYLLIRGTVRGIRKLHSRRQRK